MAYEFCVAYQASDAERVLLSGTLTDEEAITLSRFLDTYEQMAVSRPMTEGVPCEVTISVADGRAEVTTSLPTQDDLDILPTPAAVCA